MGCAKGRRYKVNSTFSVPVYRHKGPASKDRYPLETGEIIIKEPGKDVFQAASGRYLKISKKEQKALGLELMPDQLI